MKKRMLSVFLALCMVLTLAPAALAVDTGDTSTDSEIAVPVNESTLPSDDQGGETTEPSEDGDDGDDAGETSGISTLEALKSALNTASTAENKVVTLTGNITIGTNDLSGLSKNGAVITIPAGVTLDGANYTIQASGWTDEQKNSYHILSVENAAEDTTTTIQNLTIVGNEYTKSGIHAYNCSGTVKLETVTIKNCGNAAVQVNGSTVTAAGLVTENNAWGGVNVDQGSGVTTAVSFTLDETSSITEPLKVWTEKKDAENVIHVPESWATICGDKNNAYAPAETLTENVVYNESTQTYYQSLELAVRNAEDNNTLAVYPGNYNIQQDNATQVENATGWYLPITKSITIKGVDKAGVEITDPAKAEANIYSTDYSANGAWATQNLITIFADDVTISGLTIMNKVEANKAVEVVAAAENFAIKNCTFAPIAEELLPEGGVKDADDSVVYSYDDYKDYGAQLYFNGNVKNATVENNYFDHSGVSFDSTGEASIKVTGNIFEGEKKDKDSTVSTIGYVSWATPEVTDVSKATLTIEKNQLINAGKVNFSKVTTGTVDVSENYWEGMDLTKAIAGENVSLGSIYTDKEMTNLVNVSESETTLQAKIDAAEDGAVIDLEGKYWPGNLKITKNITLKNGYVDAVTAIGDLNGLTFDGITFRSASTDNNADLNPAALYLQGTNKITNVTVSNCTFQGPASDSVTIGITTLNVENLTVQNSIIDGYTISAYHNPGNGGNITYKDNEFKNIQSGIGFVGTAGITVTGNTFENANGVRLEPGWDEDAPLCSDITISQNKFLSTSQDDAYGQYAVKTINSSNQTGVAADENIPLDRNYWGSANPEFDKLIVSSDGQKIVTEPYYKADTMRPQDLSDYVPSSGGGGGGSSSSSYTVTVDKATGGTVKVSPTRASKGSTVTITVTPDEGYELDKLTVTDKNGDTVKLNDKGNDKYTFTMPSGKVTVKATFAKVSEQPQPGISFDDVSTSAYYYDAVKWAVENGVTEGTSATTFSPDASCTRAQMVTFLWRANGSPKAAGANPFTDVQAGSYYYDAVLWAVEKGITSGTSATTFAPNATVTRSQTVTFLHRANGSPAVSGNNPFTDVASDAYYAAAVQWAVAEGVTSGTSATTFAPDAACTRAQIVTFLYRDMA